MPSLVPPVFHPLVVHVPLVLLPLAAVLASLKKWWPWVPKAIVPLLIVAAISAVVAAGTGWLEKGAAQEEWNGTVKGDWISIHQTLGIVTAVLSSLLAVAAWLLRGSILERGTWTWLGSLWTVAAVVVGTGWYGGAIVWEDLEPVEFDRTGFGPGSSPATGGTATTSPTTSAPGSTSTTSTSPSPPSSSPSPTSSSPAPGYTGQETGQKNAAGLPIWEVFVETNEDTGTYGYSPANIVVPTNHEIRLHYGNFDPSNRRHDIWIGEGGSVAKTKSLNGGETDTITFTVTNTMTTIFYCDVGNHREHGMTGDFTVR